MLIWPLSFWLPVVCLFVFQRCREGGRRGHLTQVIRGSAHTHTFTYFKTFGFFNCFLFYSFSSTPLTPLIPSSLHPPRIHCTLVKNYICPPPIPPSIHPSLRPLTVSMMTCTFSSSSFLSSYIYDPASWPSPSLSLHPSVFLSFSSCITIWCWISLVLPPSSLHHPSIISPSWSEILMQSFYPSLILLSTPSDVMMTDVFFLIF